MAKITWDDAKWETGQNPNGYVTLYHRAYWYESFWSTKAEAVAEAKRSKRTARVRAMRGVGRKVYAVISHG